jgi:hypothetical protein
MLGHSCDTLFDTFELAGPHEREYARHRCMPADSVAEVGYAC